MEKGLIALFVPSLRGGGAERIWLNLCHGFIEKGYSVDLVLAQAEGPYLDQVPSTVRLINLKVNRMWMSILPLRKYLLQEQPLALLSALHHSNVAALLAKATSRVSTKVVISIHTSLVVDSVNSDTILYSYILPLLVPRCYPWADRILSVSCGLADDFSQTTPVPRDQIQVIYNPVVTSDLLAKAQESVEHPWLRPGNPPVIIGVGRFTEQKDFPTLILAFARIRKEMQARLIILGEGPERPRLEALVKELGLQEDVSLPGFVDNSYSYIRQASVFALSSGWEGLPTVIIEALAVGTPVVSTDCKSGPAEILANGKYGKLVPIGDVTALSDQILQTLKFPPPSQDLINRSTAFSHETILEQYSQLVENVTSTKCI